MLNHVKIVAAFYILLLLTSCSNEPQQKTPEVKISSDPKIANLKLPDGFQADRLFGPSENGDGSWVSMTFDNKGRMIASDQYGYLYRLQLPAIGDTVTKAKIERLDIASEKKAGDTSKKVTIGFAHGLLWAFNSLYVMINNMDKKDFARTSGLYRLQDTDGDDQFDKITLLKSLDGEGEHGPHSIVMSPDKQSLYVIAGNFTKIPKMNSYRSYPDGKLDNLLPLLKDPNGHDDVVNPEGGWIAHIDSTGSNWELISSGYRNPFDLAFNDVGDMFTYDSDMEWDIGTPWYRPTRICHSVSGGQFGWRPGSDKWSPLWPDNLPAALNVGQGSPTNVIYGGNANFPEKYRRSLFAFDWSFGIIYAIHLEPQGASYKATGEEFVSGSPLPLTDGAIGPDGALYFLTGGRKLESDLYRVYYTGDDKSTTPLTPTALNDLQQLRRNLETYHTTPKANAVDSIWPHLNNADRFIRFAARIALEHQPAAGWQNRLWAEKDPVTITQATIALARTGNPSVKKQLLHAVTSIDFSSLTQAQQIDAARAVELVLARMGQPDAATRDSVIAFLEPHYPVSDNNEMNRELAKILLYLEDSKAVAKTVDLLATAKDDTSANQETFMKSSDLIMRNLQYGMDIASTLSKAPPLQQTFLAAALSNTKAGWTPELRDKYFKWFYTAFGFRGGNSFVGFINKARKNALATVAKDKFAYYNKLSGDSIASMSGTDLVRGAPQPKGPWREWKIEEAASMLDSGLAHRNFEQGKGMFAAVLCIACHSVRGEGGIAGPNLTQLGSRFSNKDIIEAIMEPNKTISDQFANTVFYMKDGGTITGRINNQDNENYAISQNPFSPQTVRDVKKSDVLRTRRSEVSPMPPGLINRLNADELKDLMAYLKSGGNPQDSVFVGRKN